MAAGQENQCIRSLGQRREAQAARQGPLGPAVPVHRQQVAAQHGLRRMSGEASTLSRLSRRLLQRLLCMHQAQHAF